MADEIDLIDTPEAGPRVIRGGILRTASFAAGLALATFSAPLIVRHLGVQEYGRFLPILSLVGIVALLADNAMTNVAMREFSAASRAERPRLLRNLLGLRIALTFGGLVIVFAFAVVAGYDHRQLEGMALAGLGLVVADYQSAFQAPMGVQLRLGWVSAIELVRQAATVAAIAALVLAGAGLVPFFGTALVGALAALALTGSVVRAEAPWMPVFDRATWWRIVRQILPVAAATTFGVLYFRIVLIIMSLAGTADETGHFSVSFRIMEIALAIPALVVTSAFPILARAGAHDRERLRYALTRIVEVGVILGLWMSLAIWVLAPLAIDIVSGARTHETIDALRVQSLSLPGSFFVAAMGLGLLSVRDHRALLLSTMAALALSLVLSLALIGPLGAPGGALAIALTETALGTIYTLFLRRTVPIVPSSRVLVAAPLMAAVAVAVGLVLPEVVGAIAATVIYFGVLLALRVVPVEVIEALGAGGRSGRA